MSILKRQRELKKSEKAAHKRAKRHGTQPPGFQEPVPTIGSAELLGQARSDEEEMTSDSPETQHEDESKV